jgi:hypothetical protein
MKRVFKAIAQSFSQLIASESGELLSSRRKANLLQSQMHSHLVRKHKTGTVR